jgi:hypothetical protein
MGLQPLKIKLNESQKQIAQTALDRRLKSQDPFLGNVVPCIADDVLVADPSDFVILMAFAPRTLEMEFKAYELRHSGFTEIKRRLWRCSKPSTRTAYSQLIDHARTTFGIETMVAPESRAQCRPAKIRPRPALSLVRSEAEG